MHMSGGSCGREKTCEIKVAKPVAESYVVQFSYLCTFRRAPSSVGFIHDTAFCCMTTRLFSMGWLPHSVLRRDTVHYRKNNSRFCFLFIVHLVTSSLTDCALFKSSSENNIILFSHGLFYSTHDNSIKVSRKD